jgi:GTP 3',8-cyclase
MTDRFGRDITYLRISVTDLCNLRCLYCMPAEGVKHLGHDDILSFEEIVEVAQAAVDLGVTKVRITGGEPLVRRGIVSLVQLLAGIDGIEDLAMTTNGVLLPNYAADLADAGLQRVNISLDTLNPTSYRALTRGGDVRHVLDGIAAAEAAGLCPIKLNCVAAESGSEEDVATVKQFGLERGLEVRVIRVMHFETGRFAVVEGGSGGDCKRCNRLRLSSDGRIRPCLFSDIAFSVRELGAAEALRRAIAEKPEAGEPCTHNWMYGIGG